MGKTFSREKDSAEKIFAVDKYSPVNNFGGERFNHIPKMLSLFPAILFPDKETSRNCHCNQYYSPLTL